MKFVHLITLAALASLSGCGEESQPAEPQAPPLEAGAAPPSEAVVEDEANPDETVVEVEPDIMGSEPMDGAEPMTDAAPMTDDFAAEDEIQGT